MSWEFDPDYGERRLDFLRPQISAHEDHVRSHALAGIDTDPQVMALVEVALEKLSL